MASTGAQLRDLVRKTLGFANSASDEALVDKAFCRVRLSGDTPNLWATANNASSYTIGRTDRKFLVDLITITAPATIAVEETNLTTLTFSKSDGAGGALTTIGTWAINAAGGGALTALVPKVVTLTATMADRVIDADQLISVAKTVAASGTALVQGTKLVVEGYWL
jgi:hypothetical protein